MIIEETIYNFCSHITSTTSTNEKKQILAQYKNNSEIKKLLMFLYDKTIVTGISKSKLNKNLVNKEVEIPQGYDDILSVIDYLTIHNTGSDADIALCQHYLNSVETDSELTQLLGKIITKSLKLGIDTKLINTAIPGLISVHEVQQAVSFKNATLKPGEWFCLSQKLNGNRATYLNGVVFSRQGKEFTNIEHIVAELNSLNYTQTVPFVFDGEIIRKNIDNVSDNTNFTLGTGILNSNVEDKTELSFIVFDMLPLAEFEHGESTLTYKERLSLMHRVAALIADRGYKHVEVVPFLYEGTDQKMIDVCLKQMDNEGKEGCMLARDVTYKCKRHNGLLKVKTFYTMDLPIIGFETGTGKNEGTLGNVIVQYKDNTVGVGSGFTDELRKEIWENQDKYIGKIIEVKYKDLTHDKTTGKESLQFPVFVRFREDGKETSYH